MITESLFLLTHRRQSDARERPRDSDAYHVATWRKVLVVIFLTAALAPLLGGMFYSHFTGADAQKTIGGFMSYTYPYIAPVAMVAIIVGIIDIYRRYIKKN